MPSARRILVVDDNESLRENLVEALELEGYEVEALDSGAAALAALGRDPLPAAILIDMLMPGMSGQELVGAIRRDPRLSRLKVALVTGLVPARDGLEVDAVLAKPFGVEELLRVVERLLAAGAEAPAAT